MRRCFRTGFLGKRAEWRYEPGNDEREVLLNEGSIRKSDSVTRLVLEFFITEIFCVLKNSLLLIEELKMTSY